MSNRLTITKETAFKPGARPGLPAETRTGRNLVGRSLRALAPIGRAALATGARARTRTSTVMPWIFVATVVVPTLLTSLYFGLIAADRYVAEARFVVRTSNKSQSAGGLASLLQMAGISRAQDDAYAVQDYLTSRDAIADVNAKLPLAAIYGRPEADFLTRFPSFLYGEEFEELHRYMGRMILARYSSTTGVGTLTVEAFRAEDAKAVASELLAASEQLVNRMNERMVRDVVATSEREVARAEEELVKAQIAITAFRNRELLLDPNKSSLVTAELIGRLGAEAAAARVQLSELLANAPNSPQAEALRRRIAALEAQIAEERRRASSDANGGLARPIAEYERLNLQREFAGKSLATALASLEAARNDARRQKLYLEKIVEPNLADLALQPRSLRIIVTTFGIGLVSFLLFWLVITGAREHGAGRAH